MFWIGVWVGSLWFRAATILILLVQRDTLNVPIAMHRNPWIFKVVIRSPISILILAGINGYVLGGWLGAVWMPVFTYINQLLLHFTITKKTSRQFQWSTLLNPIVHIYVFFPIYIVYSIFNVSIGILK